MGPASAERCAPLNGEALSACDSEARVAKAGIKAANCACSGNGVPDPDGCGRCSRGTSPQTAAGAAAAVFPVRAVRAAGSAVLRRLSVPGSVPVTPSAPPLWKDATATSEPGRPTVPEARRAFTDALPSTPRGAATKPPAPSCAAASAAEKTAHGRMPTASG